MEGRGGSVQQVGGGGGSEHHGQTDGHAFWHGGDSVVGWGGRLNRRGEGSEW